MDERVRVLGERLREVARANSTLTQHRTRHASDLLAMLSEMSEEAGLAGPPPWGSVPLLFGQDLAEVAFAAASDQIGSFADDLVAGRRAAAFVTCRAALASSAVVAYLMEPGIGARERVRRSINEQLLALKDTRRLWRAVGDRDQPAFVEATQQRNGLVKIGVSLGFTSKRHYLGARRPSEAELIERLFVVSGVGAGADQLLSGVTRSGATTLLLAGHDPAEPLVLRSAEAALLVRTLLLGLRTAVGFIAGRTAWSLDPWLPVWEAALDAAESGRD